MPLPNCCRPLQIVHNICLLRADSGDFHPGLQALADQGIGGIVTNVPFANYLTDESAWNSLRACLSACRDLGLRVWIYDEKGYPSGAAGGRVLANHPDLEAVALYSDAAKDCLYADRSYEGTHNCRNFHAWRRTINLLEPEAVAEFIRVTHAQYAERLGPEFDLVEA
ncbi:MAG TPA: hypothetical protein VHR86_10200, partial [Armatimonadota bacterium]|nr:hypothetical protein [Armatimonadota bacterium]